MRSRSHFGHAGRFSISTFNAAHVGWWSPTPPFFPQFGSCRRINIQRGSFSSPVHDAFQSVVNVQRAETTNICVLHCIHLFLLYGTIRYTAAKFMLSQKPLLKITATKLQRERIPCNTAHSQSKQKRGRGRSSSTTLPTACEKVKSNTSKCDIVYLK